MATSDYRSANDQYSRAMSAVRGAKNFLLVLVLLGMLVTMAGFIVLNFTTLMDEAFTKQAPATATTQSADDEDAPDRAEKAKLCELGVASAMGAAKYICPLLTGMMAAVLLLAVLIVLVGRLGGAAPMVKAFFWCLVLLAAMIPWQNVFRSAGCTGALYSLSSLAADAGVVVKDFGDGQSEPDTFTQVLFWARYAAYPVLALLVLIVVQAKFAGGWRQMLSASTVARSGAGLAQHPETPL